ncbi:MAG: NADH-quinone oxidoreductase subunit NuoH [Armatimonadetes bacterium]|nr:NADH-quinone oxidoreductase subunit NuoH [Armatimonadota bacterium]
MDQLIQLAIELVKIVVIAVVVLVFMMVAVLYMVLKLRWVIARIQSRLGPNRTGPWGVLQTVADALKLLQKEDIIPCGADKWLFTIAPALVFIPAYLVYVVIPFGRGMAPSQLAMTHSLGEIGKLPGLSIGVMYLSAISSIGVIGIVVAGWASNNKWSLLGAFRGASQLIAYEVPIILAMVVPVLVSGSMDLSAIVDKQAGGFWHWNLFQLQAGPALPIAFLMLIIAGLAEINVTPFDIMEAESELVAGFNTEYSGMKFALFFLAEFAAAFTLAAIITTLFLGGYNPPLAFLGGQLSGLAFSAVSLFWFLAKCWVLVIFIMWVRSTLPRVRVDQLMNLAWKALIPVGLVNLLLAGAYVTFWMAK